jgi:hypothetical protein
MMMMMMMMMMMVVTRIMMMTMMMMMMTTTMVSCYHLTWQCWKKAWLHMCSGMYLACVSHRISSGRTRVAFHTTISANDAYLMTWCGIERPCIRRG